MVVTKMSQAKIKARECDCCSLPYGIRKKITGNKIYTKQIKPNVNIKHLCA